MGLVGMLMAARNGIGPDAMAEMLAAAGVDVEMKAVAREEGREEFERLAGSASLLSSNLAVLRGRTKDGATIHALLVMTPESKQKSGLVKKTA